MSIDIAALPRLELPAGNKLYRIHRAAHGAWFFDNSPHGRFNPCFQPGRGACYWATDPLGAFIETFRTAKTIDAADIENRRLSVIHLPQAITVVDLTARAGLTAGITVALTAGSDYTDSQHLASALDGTVDGVLWHARHDLAGELESVALFGDAVWSGAAPGRPSLGGPQTEPISPALVDDAEDQFGYLVLPQPA